MTFEKFEPRQRHVPRGRSSNDESLQNTETFWKLLLSITTVDFRV